MRNERICEECVGKIPWRGVRYKCYRDSRLYSFPLALTEGVHSIAGTWKNKVDAYIALTEFGKKKFIECGLPSDRIFVKPNFLPDPPEPHYSHDGYALYLGRISSEKGPGILINDDLASYFFDVLETIENPDFVVRGNKGTLKAVKNMGRNKWLVVIYRETSRKDGFVITSYFLGNKPKGEIIWQQN